MSLAIEKLLAPASGRPRGIEDTDRKLNIAVVFTSVEPTLAALKEAGNLAASLGARITLLVPQVVPHPLPLESPPVLVEFNENRFRVIASQIPGGDQCDHLSLPRQVANSNFRSEFQAPSWSWADGNGGGGRHSDESSRGSFSARVMKCFSRKRSKFKCSTYFT